MRIESSVTSVSWIPSEAMTGPLRVPVDLGIGHYDDPLPDHIDDRVYDDLVEYETDERNNEEPRH